MRVSESNSITTDIISFMCSLGTLLWCLRFLYENNNSGDWLVSHCGVKVGSLEAIMLDYLIVCSAYFRLLKILGISRLTRLSSDEINSFNANPEEGHCLLIDILKLCYDNSISLCVEQLTCSSLPEHPAIRARSWWFVLLEIISYARGGFDANTRTILMISSCRRIRYF